MTEIDSMQSSSQMEGMQSFQRRFSASMPSHETRRMSVDMDKGSHFGVSLQTLYLGMSAVMVDKHTVAIAIAAHDTAYLLDYAVKKIPLNEVPPGHDAIAEHVIPEIRKYEETNFVKFIGAGLPTFLERMSPTLCSRLWPDLDIVPIAMSPTIGEKREKTFWSIKHVDEQSDSMARKCLMHFGPSMAPLLHVGFRGIVQSDAAFRAHLLTLKNFEGTCGPATWDAMMHYCQRLRSHKIKIAFFSSTPQGGGVALMRHALIRFSRLTGMDLTWYVPKPRPGVFRITKNIHNTLQGVSEPGVFISDEDKQSIVDWVVDNAKRYWLSEGGPLRPVEEGGAHVVVIDDPQMPGLIPFIKKMTPDRPVLYRSHIQIRSDLVAIPGSPQNDVWNYLWDHIKGADMFISHPIPQFVPANVPREKVAYMPATTDWLDGLNKPLNSWDTKYYGYQYNMQCHSQRQAELAWPARQYIAQVARFDPAKGIPTVIDAYAEFRRMCEQDGITDVPQLCICGNGSIDDPDASLIYDQAMEKLEREHPHLIPDCSIMRLDPNDQVLNTIISNAHVVLQLSTREGFEVKVSEALHAGRPVIATKAGGIPLQVKDKVNGFLVEPGDHHAVARYLRMLFVDDNLHDKMSQEARMGISDEVGTVGNALAWYYLAYKWSGGVDAATKAGLKGEERWVNDMAREEAKKPYVEGENRLPREFTQRPMV